MPHFFITGTDTGVGKTTYGVSVLKKWCRERKHCIGLKPFATGDREDAQKIQAALGAECPEIDFINPVFLKNPMAPAMAAKIENRMISYEDILKQTKQSLEQYDCGLVEGAGGWLVPLTQEKMIRDFAVDLGLPVIVVARAGLGTLNHTLLTVESIRQSGLKLEKVVLNQFPSDNLELAQLNQRELQKHIRAPVELFFIE